MSWSSSRHINFTRYFWYMHQSLLDASIDPGKNKVDAHLDVNAWPKIMED
jgi:hypothetical protein